MDGDSLQVQGSGLCPYSPGINGLDLSTVKLLKEGKTIGGFEVDHEHLNPEPVNGFISSFALTMRTPQGIS